MRGPYWHSTNLEDNLDAFHICKSLFKEKIGPVVKNKSLGK